MVDFLEEIYDAALLIHDMEGYSRSLYAREYLNFSEKWEQFLPPLTAFCRKTEEWEQGTGTAIYQEVSRAISRLQTDSDLTAFADSLCFICAEMKKALKLYGTIDVTEDGLRLFSTEAGVLTLQDTHTNKLCHSAVDPLGEAEALAARIYDPSRTKYYLMGSGLGYFPWALWRLSDESADITIFHNDQRLISYASMYGLLGKIPSSKCRIIIESDNERLLAAFSQDMEDDRIAYYCLPEVSRKFTPDQQLRISTFNSINDTYTLSGNSLKINAWRNYLHVRKSIFDYHPVSDEWIIIGAGPSLDDHLEYLRSSLGKKTLLCVGTVLRKLLKLSIHPDCVAVIDYQARTVKQIEGLEEETVPMFINIAANWRFAEYYQGEKYLVPGLSLIDTRERFPEEWDTGGTVTSFAIEIAARLHAKSIDLVGVDLSYPNGRSHAGGTLDEKEIRTDAPGFLQVRSVAGGTVPTSVVFKSFIDAIAEKASAYKNIRFTNYSDHGAAIDHVHWYRD